MKKINIRSFPWSFNFYMNWFIQKNKTEVKDWLNKLIIYEKD